jgi:hypothetical protein
LAGTGVFYVKKDAAIPAALKIPFFTGKAILVNYFASASGKAKLSYFEPFVGEKDTFLTCLK